MPWRSALLSLGVLLLAGACAGRTSGTPLSFSTVELGVSSGIREPTRIVARTSREWLVVWARHVQPVGAVVPPPVDFSREMVVGVFMGQRETGGYQIEMLEPPSLGKRVAPSLMLALAVGAALGVGLGFCVALWAESRTRVV